MHELYLQARRDVIEERIQPKRDAAFELAALALQAEFGNRPPTAVVDYFDNHHYLVKARLFSTKIEFIKSIFLEILQFRRSSTTTNHVGRDAWPLFGNKHGRG